MFGYFISRSGQRWEDSFTYGGWRQYVCNRPGGETQCARISTLPHLVGIISFLFAGCIVMSMMTLPAEAIVWTRAAVFLILFVIGMIVPFIMYWSDWLLMKAVGPMNKGSERVLWSESK